MVPVPAIVVEIHVPLSPTPNLPAEAYPYPWIEEVEDLLSRLEDRDEVEVYDEGEEDEDAYVFFVTGADEKGLLAVASLVATHPGVPAGAFAVVGDDRAEELGPGRRVPLPIPTT